MIRLTTRGIEREREMALVAAKTSHAINLKWPEKHLWALLFRTGTNGSESPGVR